MEVVNSRLAVIYQQLREITLSPADGHAAERFCNVLNMAVPISDVEKIVHMTILGLCNGNRLFFKDYISKMGMPYLCLYTDGEFMAQFMGINDFVDIGWNKRQGKYIVSLKRNRERSRGNGHEQQKNNVDFAGRGGRRGRRPQGSGNRNEPKVSGIMKNVGGIPALSVQDQVEIVKNTLSCDGHGHGHVDGDGGENEPKVAVVVASEVPQNWVDMCGEDDI